ncbi:MAG: glycosyltransferase family 61 protein [Mucilaginibacter sp.]|nr:glycosyltransferase family 61 protein [Mucilaginibacter sp.]
MGLKSKLKYWIRQFPFIYPLKIIDSCQEWIDNRGKQKGIYFSQRGPWYKTIFPEGFLHNNEPNTLSIPAPGAFHYNRNYPTNKATLFYLQNSYLLGHKGLVLTANHQLFQEFSHHFGISSLKKFLWTHPFYTFSAKVKHIHGVGAVLISPESHNYYHWLSDVLPRIKLYESVLDQVDHFCVASNVPVKFLEILKNFGIPGSKILLVKSDEKLHFDHLFVASLPGSEGRAPQWAVNYLREKLVKPGPPAAHNRKLYFRRGVNTGRKILNEDLIITRLADDGFEIVDPGVLNVNEQIEMVQQAKIIISTHGAALSNLLFSQDRTTVIEIFSPDYFRTDCYYTLSSIMNLNYWYLVGNKPAGAAWGDILVPEDLLFKTIQQLNGG